MSKGRNSWVVSLRLPDSIRSELDTRALKTGESIGQYLQSCIIRSVNAKTSTSEVPLESAKQADNGSVHTMDKPKKTELQAMIHNIERKQPHTVPLESTESSAPFYNSEVHTTGDTVRMVDPRTKAIKVVTL